MVWGCENWCPAANTYTVGILPALSGFFILLYRWNFKESSLEQHSILSHKAGLWHDHCVRWLSFVPVTDHARFRVKSSIKCNVLVLMTWEMCHQQPEGVVAINEQKLKKFCLDDTWWQWWLLKVMINPPPHHYHHTPASTDVPKLWVSFSCCCKVRHITMETRGANGSSCRHDTPAQNSLLLQEETEEPFSISSSPHPPAEMCPHLMISAPSQTPTSSPHLPKWPLTSPKMPYPPVCAWNSHIHIILTPLCLRTATLGCRWRRSTRPQRDGARPMMPSGRAERHKPARLLWSPSGPWSSPGSRQINDLRGQRAGRQRN